MSELIDVYDRNRRPTGRVVPRETSLGDGEYRLVIHIFIFDKAGRLLIQLRSVNKAMYGGLWDVSAGGHSRAGEDSAAAARREPSSKSALSRQGFGPGASRACSYRRAAAR